MNTYAMDQDAINLKRECEEKDATIKELNSILQTNNMAGSKVFWTHEQYFSTMFSLLFPVTVFLSDLFSNTSFFP